MSILFTPWVTGQNFSLPIGGNETLLVTILDADDVALTTDDISAAAWVLVNEATDTVAIHKSLTNNIAVDTDDVVTVTIDDTDTLGLTGGLYYHELAVEDVDGNKDVVYSGKVTVKKSPALWDLS